MLFFSHAYARAHTHTHARTRTHTHTHAHTHTACTQMATQSHQRRCAGESRLSEHASPSMSAYITISWTCALKERWSHTKGCPAWRADHRASPSTCRPPSTTLQERLQARYELTDTDVDNWEVFADDRSGWGYDIREGVKGELGEAPPTLGGKETTQEAVTINAGI